MKTGKLLLIFLVLTQSAFAQWEILQTGMGRVTSMYATSDSIYASADNGVFSSSDGITWNFCGGGTFNGFYFSTGVVANDTALIASSSYGVFYSKYNQIWQKVGNGVGLPEDKYIEIV